MRVRKGWDLTTDLHPGSPGKQDEGAWDNPGLQRQPGNLLLSHASYLFLQTALVRVQLQMFYLLFFATVCHLAFVNKTCKLGCGG